MRTGLHRIACLSLILALCMSACSLNLPFTPHNRLLWSAGVVYLYCNDRGTTTYDGEVQRIVVLNKIIRIDTGTFRVLQLRGRCEVQRRPQH